MHHSSVNRRSFLRYAAVGTASALGLAPPVIAGVESDARLQLFNTHTKEFLDVIYRRGDRYDRGALNQIDFLMRDHRENISVEMDVALVDLMHSLYISSGAKSPFRVVSGYRTPKTNAMLRSKSAAKGVSKNSFHMYGQASDLFVPELPAAQLAKVAQNLHVGGVGTYSRKGFVHIDTGPERKWGR